MLTRKVRKGRATVTDKPNMGTRWARMVVRRRVPFLLAGVVALGLAAIPMSRMELGLPDDGSQPVSTTQRRAYDMLSDGFGPGFNGPLSRARRPRPARPLRLVAAALARPRAAERRRGG